mmetsp:Transcript_8354/g.20749  ORF Transcript_8354/g.20749 Transcript_8354/m.20749 type:complete len:305 (-) Transcript_8354:246-1160(-)
MSDASSSARTKDLLTVSGTARTANLKTSCPFIEMLQKAPRPLAAPSTASGLEDTPPPPPSPASLKNLAVRWWLPTPSLCMSNPRRQQSSTFSVAVNTIAPQPSPKRIHVPRSRQSTYRLRTSAPMTSTFLYSPPRMKCTPFTMPTTNPLHAAVTSNASAPFAPIAACTVQADPKMSSGEEVASSIRSKSSALMPAISNAFFDASAAKLVRLSSPLMTCRLPMPVRERIHSSFVSTSLLRSSLVRYCVGTAIPTPAILAPAGVNAAATMTASPRFAPAAYPCPHPWRIHRRRLLAEVGVRLRGEQ